MPQPWIIKIRLKIIYLKFHSNFPGANELKQTSEAHRVVSQTENRTEMCLTLDPTIISVVVVVVVAAAAAAATAAAIILSLLYWYPIITLRPRQNRRHFTDDIFIFIFLYESCRTLIQILIKFT